MITLRQIQEDLQAHLLVTTEAEVVRHVSGVDEDFIAERLSIYTDAYRLRLLEVLGIQYKVLADYLGEDDFEELGRKYIDTYPSHNFSVEVFGQHFSQYLRDTKPYSEKPYLCELSRFIWALSLTVDAADAPVLTTQDIAAVPQDRWPDMCISLHPSVHMLELSWNVIDIWQALIAEKKAPQPKQKKEIIHCAVWRKGIQSYFVTLTQQEAWVLQALQKGLSFGEVCEGLVEWLSEDEVATYAVNLLVRWLNDEMLSEIEFKKIS